MKRNLFILLTLALWTASISLGGEKKALVYMLDGSRADVMTNLNITAWKLLQEEKWAPNYHTAWTLQGSTCPDVEPSSAQNHTTILTGLSGAHHGMLNGRLFEEYTGPLLPTFLDYLGQNIPNIRTASFYGWSYDWVLRPEHGKFQLITAGDKGNSHILLRMLAGENCPDAIFVQDNDIDLGGHRSGFYPYGAMYKKLVLEAMDRFGKAVDTIRKRPSFPQEDWLIILCSDHGGWRSTHGKVGGQSSNIPLLVCGKHIPSGMMDGRYDLRDVAPWVLKHFNLTEILPKLDGKADIKTMPPVILPLLQDQLLSLNISLTPQHLPPESKSAISIPGFTDTDNLRPLTIAFHLKADLENRRGDTILLSTNANQTGTPGFTVYLDKNGEIRMTIGCKDAPQTFLVPQSDRLELGPLHLSSKADNFIIITIASDKTVTMAHKAQQDYLYWFSCDTPGLRPASGQKWILLPNNSSAPLNGTLSAFTVWARALSIPEILNLTNKQ